MEITKRPATNPSRWDIRLIPVGRPATLTIKEAAKLLGISRGFAYELARRSELPGCRRLGRRYVVSRLELERWLRG